MIKIVGVYKILNKITNKSYIGQSIDITKRYKGHLVNLLKNNHANMHLQKSFNKYGKDNFELIILEECKLEELTAKEQKWIDSYKKQEIYNIILDVTIPSFSGLKHSLESKLKMSKWKKENFLGQKNPNYGKKQSKDACLKIALNNKKTKLNITKVEEIVRMLKRGDSHKEIANKFLISRTVVTRISNGTRWKNVTGGAIFPVFYENGKRKLSDSHKKRIGNFHKGKKLSEETKNKISEKRKGIKASEETKIKLSKIVKERNKNKILEEN